MLFLRAILLKFEHTWHIRIIYCYAVRVILSY
jgi:hypothetical protein